MIKPDIGVTSTPKPLTLTAINNTLQIRMSRLELRNNINLAEDALLGLQNKEEGYTILYKYQRINNYSLDALEKGYLYFADYEELNDPFDPFINLMKNSTEEIISSWAVQKNRICSLTSNRDCPIMWSHYADSCAGMCVGYAVHVGKGSVFNEVVYIEALNGKYNAFDLLTLKSSSWAYEREWRAILPANYRFAYHLAYPISVHLGHKCTTDDMHKIKSVLPETIKEFYAYFPYIDNSIFSYAYCDINELIALFNRLPTVDEFINYVLPNAAIKH